MALYKNQRIDLTITATTSEGSGLGRYYDEDCPQGFVVFVPFTAVGDRIRCQIQKVEKNHAFGRMEELLEASPHRIATSCTKSDCKAFGQCGGCTWRHISYEAELQYKWQSVADAIGRIGGISLTPEPIVGSPEVDRYRNKAQYPVAAGSHRPLVGFYAMRSHRIVEQHDCKLQPESFATVVECVIRWAKKQQVPLYNEHTHTGLLRHIYIRRGEETGEMLVCLVCTSGKLPRSETLVQALRATVPELVGICVNINTKDTNVILGDTTYSIWGQDHLTDRLCGLTFRLSPHSFYQVNRRQAEQLYTLAQQEAALTGNEILLDLYCGTGTIGLTMARKVKQLIGVEIVPQAIEDARKNATNNSINNARFLCADAAQAARQLREEQLQPDVVIVDPPRKGCGEEVIRIIGEMAPRRVVYVSCNPATLARDIAYFEVCGYTAQRITPVDMFPRTPHVESVVCLTRRLDN